MTQLATTVPTLKQLLTKDVVKARFGQMLGDRAGSFLSSIESAVASNKALMTAEPGSVISAAAIAASLDLPINASLGFAYIVPYGNKAQFQIGWKGIVQLALRSGQYQTINASIVYEGQLVSENTITGEYVFQKERTSDAIIGYCLYFKLLNGYQKTVYWTKEETEAHGKKYSKMYQRGKGFWVDDFNGASLKTVVKMGISKWGPMTVEMQTAHRKDQIVVDADGKEEFIDSTIEDDNHQEEPLSDPKRIETKEVKVITVKQAEKFEKVSKAAGKTDNDIKVYLGNAFHIADAREIPKGANYDAAIVWAEKKFADAEEEPEFV